MRVRFTAACADCGELLDTIAMDVFGTTSSPSLLHGSSHKCPRKKKPFKVNQRVKLPADRSNPEELGHVAAINKGGMLIVKVDDEFAGHLDDGLREVHTDHAEAL